MKYLLYALPTLFALTLGLAQPPDFKPDMSRALFHNRLDESQLYLMQSDGKRDKQITPYEDEELNLQISYSATTRIDEWQVALEFSTQWDHNAKLSQLRGMTEWVRAFADLMQVRRKDPKDLQWYHFPMMLDAFEEALLLNAAGRPITAALEPLPYQGANLLAKSFTFSNNPATAETKQFLLYRFLQENPDQILRQLEIH
ncbi:MAG TPA: hypothetical protein VK907_09010, partial [Phnomibacter sp.]|nr:hypothetical protein [Phnomibacter sp.]